MKYLLDTPILLWAVKSPANLSVKVRGLIGDSAALLFLSIATPWELAVKTHSGKLNAARLLDDFDQLFSVGGYKLLETKVSHVIRAGHLPLHHRDPFDRLLAAQAIDLDIPILSRDRIFDSYGVRRIWD